MKNKRLSQSFKNAWNGFCYSLKTERNIRKHLIATILVIAGGIFFKVNSTSWIALTLAIGFVFLSELFNTSIENLTDMVTKEYSEHAKRVKDISASSVMISALVSVIIGLIVFLDPVIKLFT